MRNRDLRPAANAAANGDVMRRALDMLQEKALADQFSVVIVSHMVNDA